MMKKNKFPSALVKYRKHICLARKNYIFPLFRCFFCGPPHCLLPVCFIHSISRNNNFLKCKVALLRMFDSVSRWNNDIMWWPEMSNTWAICILIVMPQVTCRFLYKRDSHLSYLNADQVFKIASVNDTPINQFLVQ